MNAGVKPATTYLGKRFAECGTVQYVVAGFNPRSRSAVSLQRRKVQPRRGVRAANQKSYAPPGLTPLGYIVPGLTAGATLSRPSGPHSFTPSLACVQVRP